MEAAVEPTLSCPYNKAHSIIESRMQFHLSKCRNRHPTNEKAICPFNSTHIIPKVEYETHLKICENKTVHERFLVKVGSSFVPQVNLTAPNIQVPDGESWDTNEESSVSVLERVHEASKAKPTLQALIGAPKSERKAFRNQERLRIQRVLDNQGNKVGEASGSGLAREGTSGRTSVPHCSRDMQADERREPKHNINYSHNSRQTNTKECRKTTQNENTCAIPGPSRESRSRDLRNNAWGTQQNRNDLLITSGSTIYPRLINGGASSSSRGGQGLPPPPRNSNSEETRRPPTTAERRDPGNPWRVKRSPPPAARCNSSNDPSTEFPTLPAASRGRGRKS